MDAHIITEALALAESADSVRQTAQLLRDHDSLLRVVVVDAFDMRDETPAARRHAQALLRRQRRPLLAGDERPGAGCRLLPHGGLKR